MGFLAGVVILTFAMAFVTFVVLTVGLIVLVFLVYNLATVSLGFWVLSSSPPIFGSFPKIPLPIFWFLCSLLLSFVGLVKLFLTGSLLWEVSNLFKGSKSDLLVELILTDLIGLRGWLLSHPFWEGFAGVLLVNFRLSSNSCLTFPEDICKFWFSALELRLCCWSSNFCKNLSWWLSNRDSNFCSLSCNCFCWKLACNEITNERLYQYWKLWHFCLRERLLRYISMPLDKSFI